LLSRANFQVGFDRDGVDWYSAPPDTIRALVSHMKRFLSSFVMCVSLVAATAEAQVPDRPSQDDSDANVMSWLARARYHSLQDESYNLYGQLTYISSWKRPFSAAYTNLNGSRNSLVTGAERSFTASATFYLGVHLWSGGEAYYVPEVIAERPLSELKGIGGSIQNFELQKGGVESPQIYRSRAFFQQTINLGGSYELKPSRQMQLGTKVQRRRLVFRLGNFSILDFMDKNAFAGDLRQQFFNMAFMTYAAYDFGSDARGFSYGGEAELYLDDWAIRFGRISPPQDPNQLSAELRLYKYYGDQVEIEHDHRLWGMPGAVRVLGYHNRGKVGRFDEAIAAYQAEPSKNAASCSSFSYNSQNTTAPDLCWVRHANHKVGIGINLEQQVTSDLGLAFRGMLSDGQTEVYAYTPTDKSLALSALVKGTRWHRPRDLAGVGYAANWISSIHARYLRMGGMDGFIGDGNLRVASERVIDVFYSANLVGGVWLSADYQHLTNPGFNADRGPVNIFGVRGHAEF
jgi:hypothetical protein